MKRHRLRVCERTGLTIPECSCPACWARMLEREDVRRALDKRAAGAAG